MVFQRHNSSTQYLFMLLCFVLLVLILLFCCLLCFQQYTVVTNTTGNLVICWISPASCHDGQTKKPGQISSNWNPQTHPTIARVCQVQPLESHLRPQLNHTTKCTFHILYVSHIGCDITCRRCTFLWTVPCYDSY